MKRLLVPTDFSPTSEKAFRFALDIAKRSKGMIFLYHGITPHQKKSTESEEYSNNYTTESEIIIVKRLLRLKKKVLQDTPGILISVGLGDTPLVPNILEFALHNQIDLIVMGTQGARGLKKIIIGSLTSEIIEKSCIPVLLIPEKYKWKEPEIIAFADNCLKTDKQAIYSMRSFAHYYDASFTIVHICKEAADENIAKIEFEEYVSEMRKEFYPVELNFQRVKALSVTETMENLHTIIPYDLLVMLRRKKTFIKRFLHASFTKKMAYVTHLPLLVIPELEN
ncbi:universal stress protein [Daejeonella oryzae]|uniref:universal stress protein n=1 Tax=Daejeonella oryzae TaxID=1122943 RepID=UPI0004216222|nr:universal stress protein [Daejeonella oryzae]